MSLSKLCSECDRRFSCQYPCTDYSNASNLHHKQKEAENNKNAIKTLDFDKNTVVHKKNNPCVARVPEVDISHETGVLFGCEINDEKKEMLKKMLNENQGVAFIPDSYLPKKYCKEDHLEDYLEYSVGEDTWLKFINRDLPLIDLIDENAFMDYLEEQNRIYCDQNGLCPECRSPLERYEHKEEVWGSVQTVEVLPICPNGCV